MPATPTNVTSLSHRDSPLPDGVAAWWEKSIEVLTERKTFCDRVSYANEAIEAMHHLLFTKVITEGQFRVMTGRIRLVFQIDLGSVF